MSNAGVPPFSGLPHMIRQAAEDLGHVQSQKHASKVQFHCWILIVVLVG